MKGLTDDIISAAESVGTIGIVLVVAGSLKQMRDIRENLMDALPSCATRCCGTGRVITQGMAEIRLINGQDPYSFYGLLVDEVIIYDPLSLLPPFTLHDLEVIKR